jgi:hypothetical protein
MAVLRGKSHKDEDRRGSSWTRYQAHRVAQMFLWMATLLHHHHREEGGQQELKNLKRERNWCWQQPHPPLTTESQKLLYLEKVNACVKGQDRQDVQTSDFYGTAFFKTKASISAPLATCGTLDFPIATKRWIACPYDTLARQVTGAFRIQHQCALYTLGCAGE